MCLTKCFLAQAGCASPPFLAVLRGQAWLFGSMSVLTYALLVSVAFHLFVVLYEVPVLEYRFHAS